MTVSNYFQTVQTVLIKKIFVVLQTNYVQCQLPYLKSVDDSVITKESNIMLFRIIWSSALDVLNLEMTIEYSKTS